MISGAVASQGGALRAPVPRAGRREKSCSSLLGAAELRCISILFLKLPVSKGCVLSLGSWMPQRDKWSKSGVQESCDYKKSVNFSSALVLY